MKKPPQAERREMTRRSAAETKSALPSADTPDRASDPTKTEKATVGLYHILLLADKSRIDKE